MKKSLFSLLTALMMFFCTFASASTSEDAGLSAVCANYNISFEVNGAVVDYAMATPDGDNGTLDIIVSEVTDTITVTPEFTDNKVIVSGTNPETITFELNDGFAITEFEVVFQDQTIPSGKWTINAVDADFDSEESDKLIISTDLDEAEVIYTNGADALPLTVVAEYTGTAEEPITYQWYSNTQRSTEGSVAIEGATDLSYTPPTDTIGTVYYYAVARCNGLTAVSTFAEITVEAPELPTAQNVIDISDRALQSQDDEYVRLTDIKIIGVRLEKATENDTAINIVLDGNTPADAEVSFEFGAELSSAEISGHTGAVKLNDGKATQIVTINAKSANVSSWEDSVTYTLNFSLGTPSERKAERIEITKKPTKTNYTEGETFDPSGMEVTVFFSDGSSSEAESFEYSPSDELTTDDTTITVTFRENKDDENFVSADIAISVEEVPVEGGGDGFYEEPEPQYDSIKVYITFVNRGEIVAQNEQIEVFDEDEDGKYYIGDAFLNFHRMHYPGGESGYKEVSGNGLDGWVTKFWGASDPTFTYARNYKWAKSTRDSIDEGDTIAVINGTDEMFYSDLYTWFEKNSYSARVDEAVRFRVNGLNLMGSNASYDAIYAPAGASVTVYSQSGNEKEDMRTTIAPDGSFTLRFAENGTYTVKISGTAKWGIYDDAPVAPSFCTVKISDNTDTGNEETHYDGGGNYEEPDIAAKSEATENSSGKTVISVTSDEINDALMYAKNNNASAPEINPQIQGDASEIMVTIPSEALKEVAGSGLGLNVNTPVANVRLTDKAVAELALQSGELSITVSAGKDGKILIDVSAGDKTADKIDGGLKVSLPAESGNRILATVDEDGSETIVAKHIISDGAHQAMLPGSATVRIIDNHMEFTDSKGHWGENSISFVCERGLYRGVGNGRFDTEGAMTRAMLVTVLYRLEGEPESNSGHSFIDISDNRWYADSVAWASENDIVNGVSDNSFAPDAFVTREQVATILCRYAQYLDMPVHSKGDLTQFNDRNKVSDWAKEAMIWAAGAGIIGGKPGNILDSQGYATRAELAAVTERLITLMVK